MAARFVSRLPRSAIDAGEGVFIRRPTSRDRREFVGLVAQSRTLHRPYVHAPADAAGYGAYLRRLRRRSHEGYLICRRDTREIAGVINVNEIVHGAFQSGYLGYYALAPHAQQGLMTEGLRVVLRQAFSRLGLHRLEANIQPENAASIALVRRCGFVHEGLSHRYLKVGGRWRDHERWAMVAEQWRAGRTTRP